MKTTSDVQTGAREALVETLLTSQHNAGKGEYTVDLEINEDCTGWTQNQDSWGSLDLRGHEHRGMSPAILQRDQWIKDRVNKSRGIETFIVEVFTKDRQFFFGVDFSSKCRRQGVTL